MKLLKSIWSIILVTFSISIISSKMYTLRAKKQTINYKDDNITTCYWKKCFGQCRYLLPNLDEKYFKYGDSIFFIQSSCRGGLDSREACAVESAARANPDTYVIVLFAGPLKGEYIEGTTKTLMTIKNVRLYRINLKEYAQKTVFEQAFFDKVWDKSVNATTHAMEFIRILTLFKYGGIYLDLDMIVAKSFDDLPRNFLALVDKDTFGTSIIGLSSMDNVGQRFAVGAMNRLASSYDPESHNNSQTVFTQTMRDICITDNIENMVPKMCQGFVVFQPMRFYPIRHIYWDYYYDIGYRSYTYSEGRPEKVEDVYESKTTLPEGVAQHVYTHHLWNSYGLHKYLDSASRFTRLAREYCPQIFKLFGPTFGQF